MHEEKQQLRREIARQKKLYSSEQLQAWSDQLMSLLEQTELFRQAHAVACYHALPGEVQTAAFLNRWYQKKRLALPVVQRDDLLLGTNGCFRYYRADCNPAVAIYRKGNRSDHCSGCCFRPPIKSDGAGKRFL